MGTGSFVLSASRGPHFVIVVEHVVHCMPPMYIYACVSFFFFFVPVPFFFVLVTLMG